MAALVISAAGCARPTSSEERLVARAEQAMADLERLQPQLAKAGTPAAETLSAQLAGLRQGLAELPAEQAAEAERQRRPPPPPPPTAAVRCPDEGCWRLGAVGEVSAWRLRLDGPGTRIDDSGPPAVGFGAALTRSRPIDHRLEWSLGVEAVLTVQDRTGGQHVTLYGLRPLLRADLAVHDALALTLRPLLEIGEADMRLGSPPGDVVDHAGTYLGGGARAGLRWRTGAGDLLVEAGLRWLLFSAFGEETYDVDVTSADTALTWSAEF